MSQPRNLIKAPFLSGMTAQAANASVESARAFLADVAPLRQQAIEAVGAGFAARRQQRAKAAETVDRQDNPLVGLQSAPGCGKSGMLDTLALMSSKGL